jgi:hypothetical protein
MTVCKIDKLNRAPRLRGFTGVVNIWWNHNLPEVVAKDKDRANRVKCLRIAARVIAKILHHVENRGSLLGVAMDNLMVPVPG